MTNNRIYRGVPVANTETILNSIMWPKESYCEPFSNGTVPRVHWDSLFATLSEKGHGAFESDHERARRMRHEDGATVNPFDDLSEQTGPWGLDIIPFPVSEQEWNGIELGIKQRANLLEQVLADTYGPQNLLKSGQIGSELYFANSSFLRACHNIQPSGNRYLTFYAVDLYRAPDGQFRVLRDYGANPTGIGYALENRIVMSRLFSKLYHKSNIRRLAPFFKAFNKALMQRLSLKKDDPGIVLLTPGPNNPFYFEHALLSRYLGYPLVEGQDLTVRNGKVFLKKLTGLELVEAVFRQIDDQSCDPFALRRTNLTGVAGLIQVCRENNIDIVNPVGAGFIDTPALQYFLPQLSTSLLGEELLLKNRPGWWCGDQNSLSYVERNQAHMEVGSAMAYEKYSKDADVSWEKINAEPYKFMAWEPIQPSSVPAWNGKEISASRVIFRVFACGVENGFSVMPGGLAISGQNTDVLLGSSPEKLMSKDILVFSEEPVEPFSMMAGLNSIPSFKRNSDLPNRVADNLLWLGRYLERAEGIVRILRAAYNYLSGEDEPGEVPELAFLLSILQARRIIPTVEKDQHGDIEEARLYLSLETALFDAEKQSSVISILNMVRKAAYSVRDRLSIDSGRVINRLERFRQGYHGDPLDKLDETLFTLSAFSGLAMESMTRGMGWRFLDMGRRIERAIDITFLIRTALPLVCNDSYNTLQALLRVSDSIMTYRGRYRSTFQLSPVMDLLLADEGNPKSLAFQFCKLAEHIEHLPQENQRRFASKEERIALEMLTSVRLLNLAELQCQVEGSVTVSKDIPKFLDNIELQLKEFSQHVTAHYLTRVPATPHYGLMSGGSAV